MFMNSKLTLSKILNMYTFTSHLLSGSYAAARLSAARHSESVFGGHYWGERERAPSCGLNGVARPINYNAQHSTSYDSLCRRSSRSPIMLGILLVYKILHATGLYIDHMKNSIAKKEKEKKSEEESYRTGV